MKSFSRPQATSTILLALYIPSLALLGLLAYASHQTGVFIGDFTRDVTAILLVNPFVGVLSNIGILAWCSATTVFFFTGAIIQHRSRAGFLSFLLASGGLTCLLLLDDLFRVHDWIFPTILRLRQETLYIVYLVLVVVYLIKFSRFIEHLKVTTLLLVSLAFFGFSILLDVLGEGVILGQWEIMLEDGAKFLGIVGWLSYCIKSCFIVFQDAAPTHTN
jgi:hypothetical protein